MNLVDVGIVVFTIALVGVGYERGLLASLLPLIGFVGGVALGARVGPLLLPNGAESRYAALVAVIAGIVIGAFLAVAFDGLVQMIMRRRTTGAARVVDGIGGAIVLGGWRCWSPGGSAASRFTPRAKLARTARGGPELDDPRGPQRSAAAVGPAASRPATGRPLAAGTRP